MPSVREHEKCFNVLRQVNSELCRQLFDLYLGSRFGDTLRCVGHDARKEPGKVQFKTCDPLPSRQRSLEFAHMPRTPASRHVFQPVQLVRPAEVVAHRIAEAIRAGDVRVGERLPSEQDLSAQIRVGRSTLREALKLLTAAGVLEVRPGSSGGIFVIKSSVPAELGGQPLPEMPMEDLAVVMEARRLIEPQVARMAAAFGTPADFQSMHEAVALSEQAARPFRRRRITQEGLQLMTLASTRFNIAIARATQNAMMVQIMELLLRRTEPVRLRALADLDDVTLSTRTLADSLAAIESGDPELIDRATFARIALLEESWERATGKRLRRRPLLRLVAEGFGAPSTAGAAVTTPSPRKTL